jgi:glycerol-3-phosphate cytidylyltransferase
MSNFREKILTVGVFDFFHLGHLNVLEQASKLGDHLTVAVHDDKLNSKDVEFLYSLDQRIKMVSSITFVNEVIIYERVDLLVQNIDFDVFAHGEDQNHQYFQKAFDWCSKNDKKLVKLERTKGISSTRIREILKHKNV